MGDRYEIIGRLGRGGVGAIYRARDTVMGREVAIKRLLPPEETTSTGPTDESTLIKEATALARFQHPNIVTVYSVEEDKDGPFVVTELIDGDNLHQIIRRGALSVEDFASVAEQILDPLVAAQQLGLLHRDLKPANIMIAQMPDGRFLVKILDFGLAQFTHAPGRQTLDQKGLFMGALEFIAPEQLELRPLDQRTDLYSLGCVLYFCLSQESPFQGKNAAETTQKHMAGRSTPVGELRTDLPGPLADFVMRLIARRPDDRPQGAAEALREFQAALRGESPLSANDAVTDTEPAAEETQTPADNTQSAPKLVGPGTEKTRTAERPSSEEGPASRSGSETEETSSSNSGLDRRILLGGASVAGALLLLLVILMARGGGGGSGEEDGAIAEQAIYAEWAFDDAPGIRLVETINTGSASASWRGGVKEAGGTTGEGSFVFGKNARALSEAVTKAHYCKAFIGDAPLTTGKVTLEARLDRWRLGSQPSVGIAFDLRDANESMMQIRLTTNEGASDALVQTNRTGFRGKAPFVSGFELASETGLTLRVVIDLEERIARSEYRSGDEGAFEQVGQPYAYGEEFGAVADCRMILLAKEPWREDEFISVDSIRLIVEN